MTTETGSLTEFLTARLDEDEDAARAVVIPAHDAPNAYRPHGELSRWRYEAGGEVEIDCDDLDPGDHWYVTCDSEGITPAVDERFGPYIARHDPARVLAEVRAKRRIVERAREVWWDDAELMGVEFALRALASVYADHPDYRQEWA